MREKKLNEKKGEHVRWGVLLASASREARIFGFLKFLESPLRPSSLFLSLLSPTSLLFYILSHWIASLSSLCLSISTPKSKYYIALSPVCFSWSIKNLSLFDLLSFNIFEIPLNLLNLTISWKLEVYPNVFLFNF